MLAAVYPATWGLLQIWTGTLSDRVGRKWLIAAGMWVQGVAICIIAATQGFVLWLVSATLLGIGTAMVNAAMGDAGILAWEQKYCHDFWRPVVGIREHDETLGPNAPHGLRVFPRSDARL